jgi:hypothetical protein
MNPTTNKPEPPAKKSPSRPTRTELIAFARLIASEDGKHQVAALKLLAGV